MKNLIEGKEIDSFYPSGRKQWRAWLKKNHNKKESVWLICYKKNADMPTISWSDAVDEALCFGWVDSKRKPIDELKFMQFFSKRKKQSTWSRINKEKIERLTKEGLMSQAGLDCIEVAKQNGSWSMLDEVEELIVPKDLNKAFAAKPGSKKFFVGLNRSAKRMILLWIVMAKTEVTRKKRIEEIVDQAAEGKKPKHIP